MTGMSSLSALRLLATLLFFSTLCLAQSAEVKTADTQIVLEAGTDSPRLVSLRVPGKPKWENKTCEPLVKSVEIADQRMPVDWQFDRDRSRAFDSFKARRESARSFGTRSAATRARYGASYRCRSCWKRQALW